MHTTRDILHHIYINPPSYIALSNTVQKKSLNPTVGFAPTGKNTKKIKNADNDASLGKGTTLNPQFLNPTGV
jgi:hypothetical protein